MSKVSFPTEAFQTESPHPKKQQPKGNALLKLQGARLTFPSLFEPRVSKLESEKPDAKPKFEAQFIIAVESEAYKAAEAAIKNLASDKWGKVPKELKHCLRDGEDNADKGREEYKGMAFITAKSTRRPHVVNSHKTPVQEGEEECPYAGCYVNAAIELWVMDDPKWGKAIYASLVGVQFLRDGEALGGRSYDVDEIF